MPTSDSPPVPVHYESAPFDLSVINAARDKPATLDTSAVTTTPCAPAEQDGLQQSIVVCGTQRTTNARLPALTTGFALTDKPIRAQLGLGTNAAIGVHGETAMINNGKSDRVMVTYTLKF